MLRHGDISFHQQDSLPNNVEEIDYDGSFVAAKGEKTGHHHTIVAPKQNVRVFKDKEGNHWLEVKDEATITHPEHDTLTFKPGIYRQHQELEFDYFTQEIKRVRD